ncbi:hypothetical protein EVAR_42973_1 [Eumeta japonica]|uniref:DUF5641 domain-containing protein n=1 Tax=Eumeta variegata TaxID=151549 RepID=A0A4C1ZSL8_EUMVA|nr:hypothetical protein EVAR_42973_1 [Eumeta japonica]
MCDNKNWMYLPSSWNPAYPDEVQSLCLWWEGPSYLKDTRDKWPKQHIDTQTDLPELRVFTDLQDANPSRLHRYARIEQARQRFWTTWSWEYVCVLQQRTKFQQKQPDIKPDQMVLIRDESTPPMKWLLGRVTVVCPGSDGASRVTLEDVHTIIRRGIPDTSHPTADDDSFDRRSDYKADIIHARETNS